MSWLSRGSGDWRGFTFLWQESCVGCQPALLYFKRALASFSKLVSRHLFPKSHLRSWPQVTAKIPKMTHHG